MAILCVRDVTCSLCQGSFQLALPDFLAPQVRLCDDCLTRAWDRVGPSLKTWVAEQLTQNVPVDTTGLEPLVLPVPLESAIVDHIESLRQRWTTARELIEHRDLFRRTTGS